MEFRPWMLEAAFGYIRTARLAWEHHLTTPSMVNAAIGFEILFKSFQANVDGEPGGIGEQYETCRGHNLLTLFDAIPEAVRDRFGWHTRRDYFVGSAATLFVNARYPYEANSVPGGSSAIIEIAEEMSTQVIAAYKAGGCDDPWVQAYPNV